MAKQKLSDEDQVTQYIATSIHPLATTMQAIREVILSTDATVSEQIKWNAPAFYYNGAMAAFDAKEYKRDIVVFNLRKDNYILLIFPTGSVINDTTGILEGNYTDGRRMVAIHGEADFNTKKVALQQTIKLWLAQVEK
ncbi:DUF1801 domain-containing protein [Flavobacterium zepuense]|uniref:DUF1801 domain-containing protein n=1 Tax=Flavobacterium zepuense TaxID=2593302 RepID=A0A552VAJ8_9FLAO|nr:DUF1801 domain-containing protein [Flavobacterium zepuense]TRW27380.1 DUF1801 domain-containing protein [Flavobacterium zepuense]